MCAVVCVAVSFVGPCLSCSIRELRCGLRTLPPTCSDEGWAGLSPLLVDVMHSLPSTRHPCDTALLAECFPPVSPLGDGLVGASGCGAMVVWLLGCWCFPLLSPFVDSHMTLGVCLRRHCLYGPLPHLGFTHSTDHSSLISQARCT